MTSIPSLLLGMGGTPTALLIDVLGVSATRAYSTRKLRNAYAGSAIRIRRSSDNAEQDIGFVGENLDTGGITTFVGSNSAFVSKWYDQSGNTDDCVQATASQQARIVNAGTLDVRNTKANPLFDGVDDLYVSSVATVIRTVGAITADDENPTPTNFRGLYSQTATGYALVANNASATFATAGGIATISVNNGGNTLVVNGVLQQVSGTDATGTGSITWMIGQQVSIASRNWKGCIGEVIAFATQLSGGNLTAMYTNQKTYWGTP